MMFKLSPQKLCEDLCLRGKLMGFSRRRNVLPIMPNHRKLSFLCVREISISERTV